MHRTGFTTVTARAPSLEEAHEIVGRLTQAGFARNSIHVDRSGENEFEILLHVRHANRTRAEQAISNSSGLELVFGVSPPTILMIVGGAAARGAGLWAFRFTDPLSISRRLLGGKKTRRKT